MQVSHAVGQSLFQSCVVYFIEERSEILLCAVQEPTERQRQTFTPVASSSASLVSSCHCGRCDSPLRNHIGGAESEDVDGCEAGLPAGRDEHHGRLGGRVLHDGVIHRLSHGQQAGLCVAHIEALRGKRRVKITSTAMHVHQFKNITVISLLLLTHLDVELQRHRPDVGVEVECGCGAAAQPVGHVFGVG